MATKLIVSNFSKSTQVSDLYELFSKYCEINDVEIYKDPETRNLWALVELAPSDPDEDLVIDQLNGMLWRGKRLRVRHRRKGIAY